MEHILTQCDAPGQSDVWNEVGRLWTLRHHTWLKPTYGEILGCASAKLTYDDGKVNMGQTRLYQILISEAAYKIWSLQCKRVISDSNDRTKWPSKTNIENALQAQINLRLRVDCLQTNERKYGNKALSADKVKATWKGLLKDEDLLPDNWIANPGFLVGIR
ncbi:hypothetical protein AGABI2DRAFT_80021 [Agaricus bisporus var. bisporus H97]|uniref:hypothetical protein n=1 Tax=Agaricus bisporus var. bisporus (strain H97 / ATCC MYA-4626 / FGSC 10389) TaxID=936046 RepID=UPI00029F6946|nr:hypothetical protein AGABI2DRAFT_80021 [Agaricus bisporus var. bisporus H97]EKV41644.1 hypothetical protein AGABI2DRAFT_80021 [Agaricus bisporus var. bisporus H97]